MKKLVLTQKQIILTSELHAEQPFTGQNTQHLYLQFVSPLRVDLNSMGR